MPRTPLETYMQDAHPLICERARELRAERGLRLPQAFRTALNEILLTSDEAQGRAIWERLTAAEAARLCGGTTPQNGD